MKRETLHHANDDSTLVEITARQRQHIRAEAMAAYEKAKANKIPGRGNWPAFVKKYRKQMEEFLRQRHGGGLEPLPHERA